MVNDAATRVVWRLTVNWRSASPNRSNESANADQILGSGFDTNRKEFQVQKKLVGIPGRNALATNCNQQCIGNLDGPMCWDDCFITRPQAGQNRIGSRRRFIGEAPGQRR
jgi:hypothetical protein